jgi:tetratricopeptide (TPR) repeat protein
VVSHSESLALLRDKECGLGIGAGVSWPGDVTVMARISRDRIIRRLAEAEGYLDLGLAPRALEILQGRPDWASMRFEANFLTGRALRLLERYREALRPLEVAYALRPGDVGVAMTLGWCYKRTHRLAQAIDVLELAARTHPDEPLLHYNLACYWSLAGNPSKAMDELSASLDLDPELRDQVSAESDFNALRTNADFQRLTARHAPQA